VLPTTFASIYFYMDGEIHPHFVAVDNYIWVPNRRHGMAHISFVSEMIVCSIWCLGVSSCCWQ
jgi:hypothetical protein